MPIPVVEFSLKGLVKLVVFTFVGTDPLEDAKLHLCLSLIQKTFELRLTMLEVVLSFLLLFQ